MGAEIPARMGESQQEDTIRATRLTAEKQVIREAVHHCKTEVAKRTRRVRHHHTQPATEQAQRIQSTTQRVMLADRATRGIPTFRPSFFRLILRVRADWIQHARVPKPKVSDVPTLWISSSLESWEEAEQ